MLRSIKPACWRAPADPCAGLSQVAGGERARPPIAVDLWLPGEERTLRLLAEQLIWAAPLFLVPQVFAGQDALQAAARSYSYAPWLVANLTLSRFPDDRAGAPPAWDNVLYDGAGLGYVVATHQQMRLRPGATVFTCYRTSTNMSPQQRPRSAARHAARALGGTDPRRTRAAAPRYPATDDPPGCLSQWSCHGPALARSDLGAAQANNSPSTANACASRMPTSAAFRCLRRRSTAACWPRKERCAGSG
jgi:hypothetical protein